MNPKDEVKFEDIKKLVHGQMVEWRQWSRNQRRMSY